MSELPEVEPAELIRALATTLRFARWSGADAVDRAWARHAPTASEAFAPPESGRPPRRAEPAPPPLTRLPPANSRANPQMSRPVVPSQHAHPDPAAALTRLEARIGDCQRCSHAACRSRVVFGQGNPRARLLVVGDAPGAAEDAAGLPWQGEAGALLDRMLSAIGLTRRDVWLTTITLCRPPPGPVASAAILACSPFLRTQITAIGPEVVLLLGQAAAQFLHRREVPLGELRGVWTQVLDRPALATWSPETLLADASKKREAWSDLQQVQARLQALGPRRG